MSKPSFRDMLAVEMERAGVQMAARSSESAAYSFETWALRNGYKHDRAWLPFLRRCESAAEVYFLRPLLDRPGAVLEGDKLRVGAMVVALQHKIGSYRSDVLIEDGRFQLAVEVDGLAFHHRKPEQIAADYLRERRLVAKGYVVIRFTAPEVFANPTECWRQIDSILQYRRAS